MEALFRAYAYPVYSYIRFSGYDRERAAELLAGFFSQLGDELHEHAPSGHFRTFVLARLAAYLRTPALGRSTVNLPTVPELEVRFAREQAAIQSGPDKAFQRGLELEAMSWSLERLREESERNGRSAMFEALEPFLLAEPSPAVYERLARKLRSRPLGLVVALKRLRSRFLELADEALAEMDGAGNPEAGSPDSHRP